MRSKTYISKINLQRGKLTVENRKSREKKTDMLRSIGKQSEESVESVHLHRVCFKLSLAALRRSHVIVIDRGMCFALSRPSALLTVLAPTDLSRVHTTRPWPQFSLQLR